MHYRYPDFYDVGREKVREYAVAVVAQLSIALRIRWRHRIETVHICNPPDLLFLVALPFLILGWLLLLRRVGEWAGGGWCDRRTAPLRSTAPCARCSATSSRPSSRAWRRHG